MAGVRDAATVVAARDAVMAGVKDAATVVIAVKDEVMVAVAAETNNGGDKRSFRTQTKVNKRFGEGPSKNDGYRGLIHLAHRVVLDQVSQKRRKDLNSRVIQLP